MADRASAAVDRASPEHTATGKAHFEILDGLRGSAAVLVVLFHIQGITVGFDGAKVVLHHAPLMVDFFFALSGFVIGYAYDDRWGRGMGVGRFVRLRLIRLQPLAALGALLGLGSYLLDPYAGPLQAAPLGRVLAAFALALAVLPGPILPNRWEDTHPLNGPAWTLLQEYLGSLAYALALRHLSARALLAVALAFAAALAATGLARGSLDGGWGWASLWMAPLRLFCPFVTGLWLFRVRVWERAPALGFVPLTGVLALACLAPIVPDAGGVRCNGLYEAACVILLFPAIIAAGAARGTGGRAVALCKAAGRVSYPLYITHFTFVYVFMNFVGRAGASTGTIVAVAVALFGFVLLVAWAAARAWDEPIRAWLGARSR